MLTSAFDYDLPPELIATQPAPERTGSRLMHIDRATGTLAHHHFADLPKLLRPADCLIANDSKVLPVRLLGTKHPGGAAIEMLLLEELQPPPNPRWRIIGQRASRLRPGVTIDCHDATGMLRLQATILEQLGAGQFIVALKPTSDWLSDLHACGHIPLPPYIQRARRSHNLPAELPAIDADRYQTVYARHHGSAAAPTAGFHFDEDLLQQLHACGITWSTVTLHIGLDTFQPVVAETLEEHTIHSEWYAISAATVASIESATAAGGRTIAVGTTAVRTLESAAAAGTLQPGSGHTQLFITPGYTFRCTDALITNFHLPRSTLLALVAAFMGLDRWRDAYTTAVAHRYRFYSYGDAMLIT